MKSFKYFCSGLICSTIFLSTSCQPPTHQTIQAPSPPKVIKTSTSYLQPLIPKGPVHKVKVHLVFPEEKSTGFKTTNIQQGSVAFVAINVKDLSGQNLAQTGLLPVVGGEVNTMVSVSVGSLTRLATVDFYDSNQNPIGTPMKSYYQPPTGSAQTITLNINWFTTPVADTLAKLYTLNPSLAQTISRPQLVGLIERFSTNNTSATLARFPSAIDSSALSTQINAAGKLPDNLTVGLYKPATLQLNTSGLKSQAFDFEIPFLSKTQTITNNGTTTIELPPGDWPLNLNTPNDYFGYMGVQRVSLNQNETRQISLTLAPTLEVDPGVTLTNIEGLIADNSIVLASDQPTFKMPSKDKVTVIPNNLQTPITISWDSAVINDVFSVIVTLPSGQKYTYVTENKTWTPSPEIWNIFMTQQPNSPFRLQSTTSDDCSDNDPSNDDDDDDSCKVDLNIKIRGATKAVLDSGSNMVREDSAESTTIRISALKSNGDIYYWNNSGTIKKVPADSSTAPTNYYGFSTNGTCSGCHTLSHNSGGTKKIAVSNRAGSIDSIEILDRDTKAVLKQIPDGAFTIWSRDGKKLLYSTNTKLSSGRTACDLRIYDTENNTDTAVPGASESSWNETMPAWSTDETSIVFVRYPTNSGGAHGLPLPGFTSTLYSIPVEGGTPTPLPGINEEPLQQYLYPVYSPNGNWIAYVKRDFTVFNNLNFLEQFSILGGSISDWVGISTSHLYVIPHGGGTPKRLDNASNGKADSMPRWSPDGNWLAFSSHRLKAGDPQIFISRFNNGLGTDQAAFLLPGPTATDNHIPSWVN